VFPGKREIRGQGGNPLYYAVNPPLNMAKGKAEKEKPCLPEVRPSQGATRKWRNTEGVDQKLTRTRLLQVSQKEKKKKGDPSQEKNIIVQSPSEKL